MKDKYPATKLVYDLNKHSVSYVLTERVILDDQAYIPSGYACDGASIPCYLHGLLGAPNAPEMFLGAIVHDFMYEFGCVGGSAHFRRIVTRREADQLFYHTIRRNGCSWWRAQLIYWGVRVFGAKYYHKKGG